MNVTYWLVVAVLLVVALLIIIPPLWKKREIEDSESDQHNIKIAQDKAQDLKNQLEAGGLTQEQFDAQYEELESTLGDDLDIGKLSSNESSQGRWIVPGIALLFPLCSVLIYFLIGEPDALEKAHLPPTQNKPHGANPTNIDVQAMVSGLAQRLEDEPNNPQGWVMLGRSYKHLQQYKLAADAYGKAYELIGDDPEVLLQYADSLAMSQQGKLTGKAAELVFKALELSPNNETALWLGGMAKAEMGQYTQAMGYWRTLQGMMKVDSESYLEVQNLINSIQVQAQAQDHSITTAKAIKPTAAPKPSSDSIAGISVQVSLSDSLKGRVNAGETLFVYAKALTGPPMPLAIVRKQVADLPLTVTLDDTQAMMPQMKLSNFKQVKVLARISKSGMAMQQAGDFMGSVELQSREKSTSVLIVINEEIK